MSWFKKLTDGLKKSSTKMTASLSGLFTSAKIDASSLEALEEALIESDMGPRTAADLADKLAATKFKKEADADLWRAVLARLLRERLISVEKPLALSEHKPHVILLVGVNGSGKTTTAGKLARYFQDQGKSVMMAAGDTFRAAATEQLQGWGVRTDTEVIVGKQGGDAAALAYQAMEAASAKNIDALIIDTAGRLQNRAELMEELAKIHRVIGKFDETAPHDSIIVLDGTVGQNALSQTKAFQEVAKLTGMIITKLDGSAKGGIVITLADDLQTFTADEFAAALVGIDVSDIEKGLEN